MKVNYPISPIFTLKCCCHCNVPWAIGKRGSDQ